MSARPRPSVLVHANGGRRARASPSGEHTGSSTGRTSALQWPSNGAQAHRGRTSVSWLHALVSAHAFPRFAGSKHMDSVTFEHSQSFYLELREPRLTWHPRCR